MKKTLLLSALVASVATMAATTGSVEAYNNSSTGFAKGATVVDSVKGTKDTFGVKTEVKVVDSGFSFGGELKSKDAEIFNAKLVNDLTDSTAWAKYELPTLYGVNSFVKGQVKANGTLTVEAQAKYKVLEDITAGLNSKTTFNLTEALSGSNVMSTHKVFVEGNYDMVKDIKAELGVKHNYTLAEANVPQTTAKEVFLMAKASYKDVKDLVLTGEVDFKHALTDDMVGFDFILDDVKPQDNSSTKKFELNSIYKHDYKVSAVYTGVKDLKLTNTALVQHALMEKGTEWKSFVAYGLKTEVEYTGLENLTLSARTVFGGVTLLDKDGKDSVGLVELFAAAKYNYKVTDKFSVTPSLSVDNIYAIADAKNFFTSLSITPKVAFEYKANSNLTVSADVNTPVYLDGTQAGFEYKSTTVKTNLNVKYTW